MDDMERWRGATTQQLNDLDHKFDDLRNEVSRMGNRNELALKTHELANVTSLGDHEIRLRGVEKVQATLLGKIAVVASIASLVATALLNKLPALAHMIP